LLFENVKLQILSFGYLNPAAERDYEMVKLIWMFEGPLAG
jgi:hypothetical protein